MLGRVKDVLLGCMCDCWYVLMRVYMCFICLLVGWLVKVGWLIVIVPSIPKEDVMQCPMLFTATTLVT